MSLGQMIRSTNSIYSSYLQFGYYAVIFVSVKIRNIKTAKPVYISLKTCHQNAILMTNKKCRKHSLFSNINDNGAFFLFMAIQPVCNKMFIRESKRYAVYMCMCVCVCMCVCFHYPSKENTCQKTAKLLPSINQIFVSTWYNEMLH